MVEQSAAAGEMTVDVEVDGHVAIATLNRPRALNALNSTFLAILHERLDALGRDSQIRCIVLTGAGEKAFCAGADIKEMSAMGPWEARDYASRAHALTRLIENMPKPVIAAVNGVALGGGCELALACDFRIASDRARLGFPEVGLGIMPGFGGSQRLPRLVGPGFAREIIYAGRIIQAEEALRIGLVNRVVPASDLLGTVKTLAQEIASRAPLAVQVAKRAISAGLDCGIDEALGIEQELFALCFASQDQKEGMMAFMEKRQPSFEGR